MSGQPGHRPPEVAAVDEVDDSTVMVDEVDDGTVMVDEVDESTVMVDEGADGTVMLHEGADGTVLVHEVDDSTVMVDESTVMVDELDDSTVMVAGSDAVEDPTRPAAATPQRRAPALGQPVLVPVQRDRSRPTAGPLPPDPWAPPVDTGPTRVERERYAPRPVPPAPPAVTVPDGAAPLRAAASRMPSVARSTRRWARLTVAVWAVVTVACCTGAVLLVRLILR